MALSLIEEELLAETVKLYPVLYDKRAPGYKEKGVVFSAWGEVADKLDFAENGKNPLNGKNSLKFD